MSNYIFPVVVFLWNISAAVIYGISGDLRKAIYWAALAVLNAVVTF